MGESATGCIGICICIGIGIGICICIGIGIGIGVGICICICIGICIGRRGRTQARSRRAVAPICSCSGRARMGSRLRVGGSVHALSSRPSSSRGEDETKEEATALSPGRSAVGGLERVERARRRHRPVHRLWDLRLPTGF
jgi:hypothetical protein